jgi:hypothetical protein
MPKRVGDYFYVSYVRSVMLRMNNERQDARNECVKKSVLSVLQWIRWLCWDQHLIHGRVICVAVGVFRCNIFGPRTLTGVFMKPQNERQSRWTSCLLFIQIMAPWPCVLSADANLALWKIPVNLTMVRICLCFKLRASYFRRATAKFHAVCEYETQNSNAMMVRRDGITVICIRPVRDCA